MPWKEMDIDQLAEKFKIDISEAREKQRLMSLIVKTRKSKKFTQAEIGKMAGISQSRIAQIESGVGTAKITFDVLFRILGVLGKDYRIVVKTQKDGGKDFGKKVA